MVLVSKRKSSCSPSPSEEAPAKRRQNIFAMQQANDSNTHRTPSPEPLRQSTSPTREELINMSLRFSFELPENSDQQRERFRKAQFTRNASQLEVFSSLANTPEPVLNRSFKRLSFDTTSEYVEDYDEDSDDDKTVMNSESFYEARIQNYAAFKDPAPVAHPSLQMYQQDVPDKQSPYPSLQNSKPNALEEMRDGFHGLTHGEKGHRALEDAKIGPTVHSWLEKQAVTAKQPTILEQAAASKKSPVIPTLVLPEKKRTGYGLSYPDPVLYNNDEYPDTDGESSNKTKIASTTSISFQATQLPVNTTLSFTSFDNELVFRDIGSFHTARPQRVFPCTSASREDTIRIKDAAQALLRFYESMDIYSKLVLRLERMVRSGLAGSKKNTYIKPPTATDCARKLRDFLRQIEDGRIATGELEAVVKHEGEWANWMVEATRTGVMHVKGVGCMCRPDWEDQG